MKTSRRWIIRPTGFPFNIPGKPIGSCLADEKGEAVRLAEAVYGSQVIVEPEHGAGPDVGLTDGDGRTRQGEDALAGLSGRAMRIMTPIEVQMARAVGVVTVGAVPKAQRGTVKRLHAETYKPTPEISDELATKLRGLVHQLRGHLPAELLESAGDLSARGAV